MAGWSYSFVCTIMQTYLKVLNFYNAYQVHHVELIVLAIFMQYMERGVFSLPIYLMMIVSIRVRYLIIIIKFEL